MLYGLPPYAPGPKPPGEQALSDLRRALQEECQQQSVLYLAESKKLCMAVTEAYMLRGEYQKQSLEPPDLLRQELQNQLMAFALMRVLPGDVVQAAVQRSEARADAALRQSPPMSRVALLVGELGRSTEETPELEEAVAQALAAQPLFRVMGAGEEAVEKLATHYTEVAHKATQLVLGNQEALLSAMQTAMQQQRPRL